MTKQEFIKGLCSQLQPVSQEERGIIVEYYLEMIADRMENGMTEEQAVQDLGEISAIAEKHLREYHEGKGEADVQTKTVYIKKKKSAGTIVLIVLAAVFTSPVWLGLGLSLCATAFVLYLACWILLAAVYLLAFSLCLACLYTLVSTGFVFAVSWQLAVVQLGIVLLCAGLGILLAMAAVGLSKAFCRFTVFLCRKIKRCFARKGDVVHA